MEDARIIECFWQRNEEAIKEADAKYGRYCHAVADNILHNNEDSEECVNDTWMKAWGSIPPERPRHLKAFFAKITRNLAFDKYKKKNAGKRGCGEIALALDELEECIFGTSDVETELSMRELEKSVDRFVGSLPEREANVFVRRYFFTESVRSISRRLCMSENSVTVMLSRTRQKLRKYLQQEGYVI